MNFIQKEHLGSKGLFDNKQLQTLVVTGWNRIVYFKNQRILLTFNDKFYSIFHNILARINAKKNLRLSLCQSVHPPLLYLPKESQKCSQSRVLTNVQVFVNMKCPQFPLLLRYPQLILFIRCPQTWLFANENTASKIMWSWKFVCLTTKRLGLTYFIRSGCIPPKAISPLIQSAVVLKGL